ncbi:hypothetical protein AB0I28_02895 [Phytomonospora sp. NPDC050363]|uniref:hypothetical protein n=1 Tax=Phytomonospora sp. NPDC050363 TaxID=3155642 RepID=UPI00340C65B5
MTTYRLGEGASLVVRVDNGPWQTLTFDLHSFDDPEAATTGELAVAIAVGLDGIGAESDDDRLVLVTEDTGETCVLEVSPSSTAAAALGLTPGARATGSGPGSAHLTGAREPFAIPAGASMTVHVDGKARKVGFGDKDADWTAADVAENVNAKLRRPVARATGDGRVRLVSPTQGVGSRLTVTAPAAGDDVPDAAAVLGFVGDDAHTDPYRTEPARLACRPAADTVVVENLTSAPIELQLPTGRCVLPARGRIVVARDTAADGLLSRLAAQGAVRTSPERNT